MEMKKSAKAIFLDRYFGGVEDWDENICNRIPNSDIGKKILAEQEEYGNATNSGLGRELWYSNDFFINSLVLNFITDKEDDLVDELKKIYIGVLGNPGVAAEAKNMDEESDEYLIILHFDMVIKLDIVCRLVANHIVSSQISNESEREKLLPLMAENLLHLIDPKALALNAHLLLLQGDIEPVDINSPILQIASELYVAGMSFVLGHEIGHHFLKHTESKGRNIVSKFIPIDNTSNQYRLDEFAADNFGFDLLIRGMKERNDSVLLAPLIVMLMLALYEQNPEEPSEEHPSLRDRYLNLISRISEQNYEIAVNFQKRFDGIATWINVARGGYWETEWWK